MLLLELTKSTHSERTLASGMMTSRKPFGWNAVPSNCAPSTRTKPRPIISCRLVVVLGAQRLALASRSVKMALTWLQAAESVSSAMVSEQKQAHCAEVLLSTVSEARYCTCIRIVSCIPRGIARRHLRGRAGGKSAEK